MKELLRSFSRDERGQDLIEYALIAVLLAVGAVAGLSFLAGKINTEFSKVGQQLT